MFSRNLLKLFLAVCVSATVILVTLQPRVTKVLVTREPSSTNEDLETYFPPLFAKTNLNQSRYLIYHCESGCGGFGDRFYGIVNSFILALITGRKFGIHHTFPCPLQNFLKPHKYQWVVDKQALKGSSKVYDLFNHRTMPSSNMTSYFKEDVVYLKINQDVTLSLMGQADVPKRLPWLPKFSDAKLFESVFSHIFILSEGLQRNLKNFKKLHVRGNKTVCVHYRAGKNPTIPGDSEIRLGYGYLKNVFNFLSRYNTSGHVIYMATESDEVKKDTKARFPERFIDIQGKISHSDKTKDDANCTGFRKGILEYSFLQECDVILLSRSGFGRTAAFLRKKQNNMFCLRESGISECSIENLPLILRNWPREDRL